jgi:hypothetical protein
MKPVACNRILIALIVVLIAVPLLMAAGLKRSRPPKWSKTVTDAFFPDAREKLSGERPQFETSGAAGGDAGSSGTPTPGGGADTAGASFPWSKLISAETLEDEIKATQPKLAESVDVLTKFKGGGYNDARLRLSLLATLFGVIAEYDGDVRWKKQAAGVRDLMARSGNNCKVGTDASFKEAKARKANLDDLIQGGRTEVPANPEAKPKWDKITGRPPLMQRMEQAQTQVLVPWTADAGEFKKNSDKILHEAQLLAVIAEVIQREGFEYSDDETYLKFAKQMQAAALGVVEATRKKDFDEARKATGQIGKSCSACHAGYRS